MPSSGHIMMVEDSPTQAVKLSHMLEQQGWQVSVEATAEEALERLNHDLPDLILADNHLPGIKGDELCRRVRMNVNTRGIPILMLTGDDANDAEQRGLESGADDYVSKSVEEDVLVLRIRALLRKARAQISILQPDDSRFRSTRILIIDDSATYSLFLSEQLAEDGFSIETANCGEAGLERVRQEAFDCVIVDLMMPGMSGIDVCRELTNVRVAMDCPMVVLMLTSQDSKEDMTRGLEAGADDFVGKSSEIAVLKARIRALVRRKYFQEENQRIVAEMREKELETVRANAALEAAQVRAALSEQLEKANGELQAANLKLKETQSHLLHSEKMASLGQLVAGIAHEINNPLSFSLSNVFTIREGIEKLMRPFQDSLDDAAAKKLDKICRRCEDTRKGLERVTGIVQKLRTFSRLDSGEFGALDVPEGIEMALTFLSHKIRDRIEIVRRYDCVREIDCYPGELNQVFMNVLSNAVDAIDGRGTITISTTAEDGRYLVRIADTGCGISPAMRERIFEPFFTTKPVGQGMGFGLSLVYGVMQTHRGEISVESVEGQGAEFTIAVPLDLSPATPESRREP